MKVTVITLFLSFLLAGSNAGAEKLYKWVDADGNIFYQNQPPPKSGKIISETTISSKPSKAPSVSTALPTVEIYTIEKCEACDAVIAMLREWDVPYIQLPLKNSPNAQQRILQKASSIIIPTVFVGDDVVQGNAPEKLKEILKSAGLDIANEGS